VHVAERFRGQERSSIRLVHERALALEQQGADVIHLEIGEPDFDTPELIKAATHEALDAGLVHYGPSAGVGRLRERIAENVGAARGIELDPSNVIVVNGATQGLFVVLTTLLDPGDEVIVFEPLWPAYLSMIRLIGGVPRVVPCPAERSYCPDPEAIIASVSDRTRAILINSPCNPTGVAFGSDVLNTVATLASEHDLVVVSDETYDHLVFADEGHVSVASLSEAADRTVLVGAFSKTYAMTGWRVGYLIVPEPLARAALMCHSAMVTSVNTFVQYGALAAIEAGATPAEKMREAYSRRHDLALGRLAAWPGVECINSHGTFFLFPRFTGHIDDGKLATRLLEEAHVATVPGSSFGVSGSGHLRLSIAADDERLEEGLARIEGWLLGCPRA